MKQCNYCKTELEIDTDSRFNYVTYWCTNPLCKTKEDDYN